ncbi:hypothetical protein I8H83_03070 [Candidatus Saccharibacteria bacterium]|nr:hypothetical protein [Candidatus Saccharibacteria bacterium]
MTEKLNSNNNFDQIYNETEKTYRPRNKQLLERFRSEAGKQITQPYLSDPSEQFSLRLRHTTKPDGNVKLEATLKSAGEIVTDGKSRTEYPGGITQERFDYYTASTLPTVRKRRVSPLDAIDIDFFESGDVHVESEDPLAWNRFLDHSDLHANEFEDVTGLVPDNELLAHINYRRSHGGRSAFTPYRPFDTDIALESILPYAKSSIQLSRTATPIIRVYGRSGSGKSHCLDILREKLATHGVDSAVLSTDDYNRGIKALTEMNGGNHPTDFDTSEVYDLDAARTDLLHLLDGSVIQKRTIDYATSEPVFIGELAPPQHSGVLFVEGIWARHSKFDLADLTFDVGTPIATSIGQRITRDLVARPEFADPSSNLQYYLEHAEPAYRST